MILVFFFGTMGIQSDSTPVMKEHQIKAAYLYSFAKFVDWPSGLFPDAKSPFVIGVFGTNPFGSDLETVIKDRSINEHPVRVVYLSDVNSLKICHVLFIPEAEDNAAGKLLSELGHAPVLTVGESTRFKEANGAITFITEKEKVRFEINVGAAEKAGLKISSQLQKLAKSISR